LLDFVCLQVDSANKYGTLLEVVQVLTDLKLTIKRGYISSDGEWFMDGECRLLCDLPALPWMSLESLRRRWEKDGVPFRGDAKPGFCLGCNLSSIFFPILMCGGCGFASPFCSVPCRGSGWE